MKLQRLFCVFASVCWFVSWFVYLLAGLLRMLWVTFHGIFGSDSPWKSNDRSYFGDVNRGYSHSYMPGFFTLINTALKEVWTLWVLSIVIYRDTKISASHYIMWLDFILQAIVLLYTTNKSCMKCLWDVQVLYSTWIRRRRGRHSALRWSATTTSARWCSNSTSTRRWSTSPTASNSPRLVSRNTYTTRTTSSESEHRWISSLSLWKKISFVSIMGIG